MAYNFITAQEAAQMIPNGATVGFSGFTAPGAPKFITEALAAIAEEEHAQGRPFKINILSGASTSDHADGAFFVEDAALFDTDASGDPFVVGVDHFGEHLVVEDVVGHV